MLNNLLWEPGGLTRVLCQVCVIVQDKECNVQAKQCRAHVTCLRDGLFTQGVSTCTKLYTLPCLSFSGPAIVWVLLIGTRSTQYGLCYNVVNGVTGAQIGSTLANVGGHSRLFNYRDRHFLDVRQGQTRKRYQGRGQNFRLCLQQRGHLRPTVLNRFCLIKLSTRRNPCLRELSRKICKQIYCLTHVWGRFVPVGQVQLVI